MFIVLHVKRDEIYFCHRIIEFGNETIIHKRKKEIILPLT